MNFVPCITWVKRGVAREVPEKVQLSKADLKRLIEESVTDMKELKMESDEQDEESNEQDEESPVEVGEQSNAPKMEEQSDEDDQDVIDKYNLESYDDETSAPAFSVSQLADFSSDSKDFEDTENQQVIDSDDEDNFRIRPQDNLITVGHVSEDCSVLEIYVYNEEDDDLYVHHDIILPAFPISLEWISYGPNEDKPSNYLAVGDMTPVISIWDLDMVDIMEPIATLGQKVKKKKKKKDNAGELGHIDAVLDLSWNKHLGHALASGSADSTVIMWDLTTTAPVTHLRHHKEKVQCVEWHPFEAEILLTGSSDRQVSLFDARAIEEKRSWNVNEEVERLVWNHFEPFSFLAGTDQGNIFCFDVRQSDPLYTIDAHNKGISDLCLSSSCPGLLASTGSFTSVKIWDIRNNQPQIVESKKLKEGNLLVCRSSPDSPFTIAVGGDKPSSNFRVINLMNYETVRKHFAPESTEEKALASAAPEVKFESGAASCSQPFEPIEVKEENKTTSKKMLKKKTLSKKKWK